MITHARGNYRAGRQGDGTARRPCHLQPRASSPALGAELRRRHAGACRHVVSSGRRPIDSAFPYPRFGRGALATQTGGGSVRTSEHPWLSVRRAENRLAPRYPFLASTLLSYFALRTPNGGVGWEGYADLQLLAGLVLLVTCGSMLTWE